MLANDGVRRCLIGTFNIFAVGDISILKIVNIFCFVTRRKAGCSEFVSKFMATSVTSRMAIVQICAAVGAIIAGCFRTLHDFFLAQSTDLSSKDLRKNDGDEVSRIGESLDKGIVETVGRR